METEVQTEVEVQKKYKCSAKCTAGCKSCICSKNGEVCDKNCACTNCKNTKAVEDSSWVEGKKKLHREDASFGGPLINFATIEEVFSAMWTEEIWQHIVQDTNQYRTKKQQQQNSNVIRKKK